MTAKQIPIYQGSRHEVLIGGGGDGFMGNQTHLLQNLVSPRISATLFEKCWKMQNCININPRPAGAGPKGPPLWFFANSS